MADPALQVVIQAPTAMRPTLAATIDSLNAADLPFEVRRQRPDTDVIGHLTNILDSAEEGTVMLRLEDDVEVGRHIAHNIRAWSLWRAEVVGALYYCPSMPGNLRGRGRAYTPPPQHDAVWWPHGIYLYGACGLLMPARVARALAAEIRNVQRDPPPACYNKKAGRLMQDQTLCEAAARLMIPVVSHFPPLVEHRGGKVSTWRGKPYPRGTGNTNDLWSKEWRA